MSKVTIEHQVEAMKAVIISEEVRQTAYVARGEITQDDADLWLGRLRAALATLEWIRMNRKPFLDFVRYHDAPVGPVPQGSPQ